VKITIVRGIIASIFISSGLFLEISPGVAVKSASEYRQLGLSLRQQGKSEEAIAVLQKSVELEPQNLSGRVLLGWTQHLAQKRQDATKSLLKAVSQNPYFVPAYNALGIVYLVDSNLASSVLVHTWAAILKPDNEIAYFNLSLALHRLQVYPLAIICANRAATLEPSNPHPLIASAISYWDSGNKTFAKGVYNKAINLDSRYSDSVYLNHLKEAAFTLSQIKTTDKVRTALP
jgi:tetratricopeptide (TPR) repeat protein